MQKKQSKLINYSASAQCNGCSKKCYIGTAMMIQTKLFQPAIKPDFIQGWLPVQDYIPIGETEPQTLIYGTKELALEKIREITQYCKHRTR